jgi:hypothetical protein
MDNSAVSLDHDVYLYESSKFPAVAIASFLFEGLAQGENAVVIASKHHSSSIEAELSKFERLTPRSQSTATVFVDVASPTRALLAGNTVESVLGRIIAPAVQQARARSIKGQVRIYGELADAMFRLHNPEVAKELERQGGLKGADGKTKIWCGYSEDTFPDASHAKHFTHVCLLHNRIYAEMKDHLDWRLRLAEGIERTRRNNIV